jgi:STE24 endopeptidase
MSIYGFVSQPISNSISRAFEYQSDEYSMQLSGVTGEEAATAFDKLSVFNLSDPSPSPIIEFWFYDHPALEKRIKNVRELYARNQTGG